MPVAPELVIVPRTFRVVALKLFPVAVRLPFTRSQLMTVLPALLVRLLIGARSRLTKSKSTSTVAPVRFTRWLPDAKKLAVLLVGRWTRARVTVSTPLVSRPVSSPPENTAESAVNWAPAVVITTTPIPAVRKVRPTVTVWATRFNWLSTSRSPTVARLAARV